MINTFLKDYYLKKASPRLILSLARARRRRRALEINVNNIHAKMSGS